MAPLHLLLVYHSGEGQTGKIADRIAATAREAGATVDVWLADDADAPSGYDGVILGDSIHIGRHSRALTRYAARHADELDDVPVALFQVSLTSSHDDPQHAAEAQGLVQKLLDATGLDPDIVGLFAGALAYTRYGWFKRHLMQRIAASEGGDTDASTDHEYTDWDAVDDFTRDALALFESARTRPS